MSFVNSTICPGCAAHLIVRTEVTKITKVPIMSCFSQTEANTTKCPQCACEYSITVKITPAPLMGTAKRPDFMDSPIEPIVKQDLFDVFPPLPLVLIPTPKASDSRVDNKG